MSKCYKLGIDIGSTTVKIAIIDEENRILFSDYKRHFANIQETLKDLLILAKEQLGSIEVHPVITGSGGLTLAGHMNVPFVQEVIAVSTSSFVIASSLALSSCMLFNNIDNEQDNSSDSNEYPDINLNACLRCIS